MSQVAPKSGADRTGDQRDAGATIIMTQTPPVTVKGILSRLGPGLIIAASIVGSGELIATTKTGADAGFTLLWLILIGCVIKVFVQVEFGRFAITEGRTSLDGMNDVPGPRLRVGWLVWCWIFMFLAGVGQLGGIVGGVGQSMAMAIPLRGDFAAQLDGKLAATVYTYDDVYWTVLITVMTAVLLVNGRYRLIETIATFLVAGFTLVTIFNVFAVPYFSSAEIGWEQIRHGLSFRLPGGGSSTGALTTALATFGIIGVGAAEVVSYPYWCLEKGYARFSGKRDSSTAWAERAAGWLRVMRWDVWCSMVIYTFATMAFYVLGAAVLHPRGLSPSGSKMIRTLATMYDDVFSPWGDQVFLFGAFAVLYSTFFVATAGNARLVTDVLGLLGVRKTDETSRRRWVRALCGIFPFVSASVFLISKDPVKLVLISGFAQAMMLPLLGGAALFFRYKRCDLRITPGRLWDILLWLSVAGLVVSGTSGVVAAISKMLK